MLLTDEEMSAMEEIAETTQPDDWEHKWEPDQAIPLAWAADVVNLCRKRNIISSDVLSKLVLKVGIYVVFVQFLFISLNFHFLNHT